MTKNQTTAQIDSSSIFSALPAKVQERLIEAGITSPTEVQTSAFQPILDGADILAQSMTGSGKTLAFALPTALKLAEIKAVTGESGVQALVLTPTRELATQVSDVFKKILSPLGVKVCAIIGGASYSRQEEMLNRGVDVVIGTPGRIQDLLDRRTLNLKKLKIFVLDEVDQMLDFGFAEDLTKIQNSFPNKVQTLFFSATISGYIGKLANELLVEPTKIKVAAQGKNSPSTISHQYLFVKPGQQLPALVNALLYYNPEQAIIFCETKKECGEVTASLIRRGFNAAQLNSDLGQNERQATMSRFRSGELRYLVATNVAARGIDVQDLPLVVNFGVPREFESYTHRCGRTGRAGASGLAWTLVTPRDIRLFINLMREVKITPELCAIPDRVDIIERVTQREIQSLTNQISNDVAPALMDVIDRALNAIPMESAHAILGGFLAQRIAGYEIYNSETIRCTGELTMNNRGPSRPHDRERGSSYPRRGPANHSDRVYRAGDRRPSYGGPKGQGYRASDAKIERREPRPYSSRRPSQDR